VKTHCITIDNAWPALKEKGLAGTLPVTEAYPVHAFASDLHYTLLPSGIMTCLFGVSSSSGLGFGRILESLPPSSGLQMYSHHVPGGEGAQFLALSSLVAYRYPFSPSQGFASLLSGNSLARELENLEGSTRDTFGTLVTAVAHDSGSLRLLGNPTPLLQVLGPLRLNEASLECRDTVTFNLSYLLLGPSRLALLVEFNAFPAAEGARIPNPASDLEYLSATCIHQPEDGDLARLDSEVEDYLLFLNYFRKANSRPGSGPGSGPGAGAELGFPGLDNIRSGPSVTLKGKVLAKHYVLLFGTGLADLRLKAQDYFRDLCRMGISFHASMIRTRENYRHLYPGCYRLLTDGVRMEAGHVPAVLRALHP